MTSTRVTLNDSDPFEAALLEMLKTNRAKRADYSADGSPFWNFEWTADKTGTSVKFAILFNIYQKLGRLVSLDRQGKEEPANESLADTYKDLSVYATLLYAYSQHTNTKPRVRKPRRLSKPEQKAAALDKFNAKTREPMDKVEKDTLRAIVYKDNKPS